MRYYITDTIQVFVNYITIAPTLGPHSSFIVLHLDLFKCFSQALVCPGPRFTSASPYVASLSQPTGSGTLGSCGEKDVQGQEASASQSISNVPGGCRMEEWTQTQTGKQTDTHTSYLHKAVKEIWPLFLSTFQPFSYYQLVLSNLFWGLASLLSPRDICVHEGLLENRKPFKISQNESLTVNQWHSER